MSKRLYKKRLKAEWLDRAEHWESVCRAFNTKKKRKAWAGKMANIIMKYGDKRKKVKHDG